MPQIFPDPPSSFTGSQRDYLQRVAKAIRALPQWSTGSLATPNSVVTGMRGDWFENIGSPSTLSRLWYKAAPDNGVTASTTSWVLVRILG